MLELWKVKRDGIALRAAKVAEGEMDIDDAIATALRYGPGSYQLSDDEGEVVSIRVRPAALHYAPLAAVPAPEIRVASGT